MGCMVSVESSGAKGCFSSNTTVSSAVFVTDFTGVRQQIREHREIAVSRSC